MTALKMKTTSALIPSLLLLFPVSSLADLACRPDGPVVPRPTQLSESTTFTEAGDNLASLFDQAIAGDIKAGWPVENSSFSLALVSLDQEDPGVPLWEYHHLAENNVNGTESIDRDSQYLIGSISKAFTNLALIKSGLDLDSPVTKYLPELKNHSSTVDWESISLRSLGNHQAGIPSNYGFSEYAFLGDVFESLGFPAIDASDYPICGVIGVNDGCTKQTLLSGLSNVHPIVSANERPAYSNVAFSLIALAIEAATGKTYADQIQDYIASPLGMADTRPSPGDDDKAVIPPVENSWGSDYGINAPGGGLVSTVSDLSALAHSILSRSVLSPSETRAWLKPDGLTGSASTLVGMPWEIYRPAGLVPEHPEYVPTIFAKSGGAFGYRSQLALLDSHGVGLVVLTAGDMTALTGIYGSLLATFIPVLDQVARSQAEEQLSHSFASSACSSGATGGDNTTTGCVEAALTVNDTVRLASLTRDGNDMLAAIGVLWENTIVAQFGPVGTEYQLFPTEDVEEAELPSGRKVAREAWRLWPTYQQDDDDDDGDDDVGPASDLPGQYAWASDCFGWTLQDWIHYGGEPLDRIVVVRDAESGEVVGVDVPFLRSGIMEVKDE